jgi:2-polyprenyl-3-methyl-5-hydroxy-6-metoxy-1,4-benzoquinol methylase
MKDREHYEAYWEKTIAEAKEGPVPSGGLREEYVLRYLTKGKRLLDIGCGGGALAEFVGQRYEEMHGIDISEVALEIARKRGMNARLCNLNSEALPYESDFFDTVVSLDVVEHVFDPFHFFGEIAFLGQAETSFCRRRTSVH